MATKMNYRKAPYGETPVMECPDCHTVCVYWDRDDLDEYGNLLCYCTESDGDTFVGVAGR